MSGDHRAFLDATLPCLDVVYQVARHAAVDGQEPEDLVQETYLRAYAAFGSWRGGSTRAWLAAICLKAARSGARRRRRRAGGGALRGPLGDPPGGRRGRGEDAAAVARVGYAGHGRPAEAPCLG